MAACNGYIKVAKLLIKRGSSIYAQDKYGRTTLRIAIRRNHILANN
ncbi:MAG: ankyrin repeat domain-containing protein [Candidatus Amoebophilus sp.]